MRLSGLSDRSSVEALSVQRGAVGMRGRSVAALLYGLVALRDIPMAGGDIVALTCSACWCCRKPISMRRWNAC